MSVIDVQTLEHEKLDEIKVRLMIGGQGFNFQVYCGDFYEIKFFEEKRHTQQQASMIIHHINSSPVYPSLFVVVGV